MSARRTPTPRAAGDDADTLPRWLGEQVGRAFPGGRFRIEPWLNWLVCDAVVADPPSTRIAHPLMPWIACTLSMGVTWEQLFAWFGSHPDDGPMFGEHRTIFHEDLLVGREYEVTGRITSVRRKNGQKLGTFDLVDYAFTLTDGDDRGLLVAECHNSLVLPRRATGGTDD